MQQDWSSHVCAGVVVWILCYDLHRRYGTPGFLPRQVTKIAAENLSHGRRIEEGLGASLAGHGFGVCLLADHSLDPAA